MTHRHVGSFWTRDRTCMLFVGRQILYPRATMEALHHLILKTWNSSDLCPPSPSISHQLASSVEFSLISLTDLFILVFLAISNVTLACSAYLSRTDIQRVRRRCLVGDLGMPESALASHLLFVRSWEDMSVQGTITQPGKRELYY